MNVLGNILVREAAEGDIDEILGLFQVAYGHDYAFPQFFDPLFLKRLVFSDDCLILVAQDQRTRQLLGTGSVVFDVGAFADLVGEFGRLVVHPDGRGRGIGKLLMEDRLIRVGNHLHVALADNRVAHTYSQKIALCHGFAPVGYLPIHNGEPVALFARYFNGALSLRRNHPRVAPSVHWLAEIALRHTGLPCDVIVDESASAYPAEDEFELEEMSSKGYASLLRFERGRLRNRGIFGPVKLHFGYRQLERHNTNYLLAKQGSEFVGAIGYARDPNIDNAVRIFELIHLNERPVRFLLSELERRCRELWHVDYVETNVSADAPRMQKTLIELGFLPVAYVPAGVFHNVERLDTVRMSKHYVPVAQSGIKLVDEMKTIAKGVIRRFERQWIEPVLAEQLPRASVFHGLNAEQTARLANLFQQRRFLSGDWIIREGQGDGKAYVVIDGEAEIIVNGHDSADVVGEGEFLGELALLNESPHGASVRARGIVNTAVIEHDDLNDLIRNRGDIGFTIYRNLAAGLGAKLKRSTSNAG